MMAEVRTTRKGRAEGETILGLFVVTNSPDVIFPESDGLEEHVANSPRGIKGVTDPLSW
jgi:hypothetical protein